MNILRHWKFVFADERREREIYIFPWLQVRITRHHLTSSLRSYRRVMNSMFSSMAFRVRCLVWYVNSVGSIVARARDSWVRILLGEVDRAGVSIGSRWMRMSGRDGYLYLYNWHNN